MTVRPPHRFLERRKTRDAKVPRSADDPDMETGWQGIPIPPTDDPAWFILDTSRDYKTEWGRWHEVDGTA
jgi:hypothetical protein